jgi:hypothetical protein
LILITLFWLALNYFEPLTDSNFVSIGILVEPSWQRLNQFMISLAFRSIKCCGELSIVKLWNKHNVKFENIAKIEKITKGVLDYYKCLWYNRFSKEVVRGEDLHFHILSCFNVGKKYFTGYLKKWKSPSDCPRTIY